MTKRKREANGQDPVDAGQSKKVRTEELGEAQGVDKRGHSEGETDCKVLVNGSDQESSVAAAKRARKAAKRERRASARAHKEKLQSQNGPPQREATSEAKPVDHKRHKRRRDTEKLPEGLQWKISDPVGGKMLDLDAAFSSDEQFLLLAYKSSVAVYSTSTSLLVRRIQNVKAETISGFAISPTYPNQLYIARSSGVIESWDWTTGSRLNQWKISSSIYSVAIARPTQNEEPNHLLYTIDKTSEGPWLISAHRLIGGGDSAETDVKTLLKFDRPITSIKVTEGGRVIVANSGSQLIIGASDAPEPAVLRDIHYVWRVIDCPEWISSIDVRTRPSERTSNKKHKTHGGSLFNAVDVAVGGLKGSIHLYEDLLRKLTRKEKIAKNFNAEDITSRRLHWHRNAVLTIKWSLDGNYIISGGEETVLVLWQLETGQRQDLPHLGASVESIVVSPTGSSYCTRLADNSAMIISTSELQPTFSMAGIQLPAPQKNMPSHPFVPTVDAPKPEALPTSRNRFPACVASTNPGQLILAVPPSTSSGKSAKPQNASYLQTLDIKSGLQVARQALTRTKITTLNMGPESNTIEEPNVTHMQASQNGEWLATVDVWVPPRRDVAALTFDEASIEEEQRLRKEIYLRFWSWNAQEKVWELVSRIDNPHASDSGNPYDQGRVLDLASDPSSAGFSSIGEDGIVKSWKPVVRRRNGLEVRGKDGKALTVWRRQHTIPVDASHCIGSKSSLGAKLAYSADGSVLAFAFQTLSPSPVCLIDTNTGTIRSVHAGLCSGPMLGVGIIDRYLIVLSSELCVWDLVSNELHYGVDLQLPGLSRSKLIATSSLAVNVQNRIFAVAIPDNIHVSQPTASPRSKIAIFDPTNPQPLFLTIVPNTVTALLPTLDRKGFHAIDSAAELRTIMLRQSVPVATSLPKAKTVSHRGLDGIFGSNENVDPKNEESKQTGLLTTKLKTVTREVQRNEGDANVVSQDKLAEIFDVGPAFALPSVNSLFEQVAVLYAGQTV